MTRRDGAERRDDLRARAAWLSDQLRSPREPAARPADDGDDGTEGLEEAEGAEDLELLLVSHWQRELDAVCAALQRLDAPLRGRVRSGPDGRRDAGRAASGTGAGSRSSADR